MFKLTKLNFSQRETIISHLKEESKANNGYFLLIILSIIITTLGLVLNSPAVIIGGMIVSPLLYPIIAIGAAIVTGDNKLIKRSLILVVRSSAVTIAAAVLITLVSPLKEQTHEILTRTSPTLIDLIIALASGAAGAYAVTIRQRFAALMGVAVSAALVPPLAITGFGLSTTSYDLVFGSFLLYTANLIAVIVATIVVFYLLGFGPGRTIEKKTEATRDFAISLLVLIVVMVILSGFLLSTIFTVQRQNMIEGEIRTFLKVYSDTTLIELTEKDIPGEILIKATIQSPSQFTQKAVSLLDQRLEDRLDKKVNLQILIIPVTKLVEEK